MPHGSGLGWIRLVFEPASLTPEERIRKLERQLERERAARKDAEEIAEKGLRDLYVGREWLALLQRITDGANRTDNLATALEVTLREVCEKMGWTFGNAYTVDDPSGTATACNIWYASGAEKLFPFVDASRSIVFSRSNGLPGRGLEHRKAQWMADIREEDTCPRRGLARACGIISAFAFPVKVHDEIVAIVEFFSHRPLKQNDAIISTMTQIGAQLGRVVERERSRENLLYDATHDSLTGLPNMALLDERSAKAFAKLPESGEGMTLMVIDLDGFKTVNDRFGHLSGDFLIKLVAKRLAEWLEKCRQEDAVVSGLWNAMVARTGGDEFVILLECAGDSSISTHIAQRLQDCLSIPFDLGGDQVWLAASIGIAASRPDHEDYEQILKDADLAMYEAKGRGRGQTVLFSEQLGARIRTQRALERELNEAIQRCEFVLHYQPICALDEAHTVRGYEALVRWNHAERGVLPPDQFIPLAESAGLINFLGGWILREACEAIGRLSATQRDEARFISVNVAPSQILHGDFAGLVKQIIMQTGIDPSLLRLEITESAAIIDPKRTVEVLTEVREWGVRTSLDDFGTGYSSLSYLKDLPFDSLKIDRSFVSEIDTDKSRNIVKAILDLAKGMELSVIAEGIEEHSQSDLLTGLGCCLAQGYLYGRPMAEEKAFAL